MSPLTEHWKRHYQEMHEFPRPQAADIRLRHDTCRNDDSSMSEETQENHGFATTIPRKPTLSRTTTTTTTTATTRTTTATTTPTTGTATTRIEIRSTVNSKDPEFGNEEDVVLRENRCPRMSQVRGIMWTDFTINKENVRFESDCDCRHRDIKRKRIGIGNGVRCMDSKGHFNLLNFTLSANSSHPNETVRWPISWRANTMWRNHVWRDLLKFLICMLSISICSANSDQCAAGLKTAGRTWPQGDIVLEYGQSLRIYCMLNKTYIENTFPGKNASDLVFFRNKKEMEPEFVGVINETTISLYVKEPPPSEDMYYCKLKTNDPEKPHEAVCLNKVAVGFKPQKPENFTCVSHNWENMACSWDPVKNYVTTRFTLVFKLPGRAGGRKLFPCPQESQKSLPPNTCLWDTSTNPIYRQPYEYYTFILNVENVLGNISVLYKFHHFAHVIPAKPANLSVVNKTSDSALLYWSVPFPMENFPPGLHHRITYQNQWDHKKTWQVMNITNDVRAHKRYFNLTGLKYANTVYDVRVFIKSAVAVGEDKWSKFSDVTFRTPARLPGLPPRTDIGSFEIAENSANRDVYLYWQAIPPYLENGDYFKYQVSHVEENGRKIFLIPNETTRTYAKFKGISFNNYRFEVVATNIVGANKESGKIFVPSQFEIPQEPVAFTKIAFDGGLYELSWKPPVKNSEITNYTIFWCDNDRDRPYQCTGYLDWVHVSRDTTIYNMTVPDPKKVYQFAISANTKRASSGMVWASCTVIHNRVVGKMKSVWINRIGSDFIEVGWKLDCSDRIGIVDGFKIYYCPIVSPYNLNCKGPKLNTTIKADPHTIHGVVNGLKPYTTYSLSVSVLTKSGEGLHSDPLYNTTLEAAPATPPQDVEVSNVTNTTMFVSWTAPSAMNGVLRYYEVFYNEHSLKVEDSNQKSQISVEIVGLLSYKNYSIQVAACTVSCSVKSPAIYKMTDIGVPGKINEPNVRFMNSSQVVVLWNKPQNSGGSLDYYEISSSDGEIQNSSRTEAHLPIPDCKTVGREKLYQFRVRAVNIAPDGTRFKGPWSDAGEGNCYSDGPSYSVWVIIWVIGSLSGVAILLCLVYTSQRMWLKCKAMQDIDVKLPPGLAPDMKLLQKVKEQPLRPSSADSSGCSSGQESVTSSLTSDSHVSSDSGTEVDPVPPSKLMDTPQPTWESSSLRQRNVGGSRPVGGAVGVGAPVDSARWGDPYVKVTKTGEPILGDTLSLARSTPNLTDCTGYAASQQTWSSTGYISMPSSEELSSNPSPVPKEMPNASGYSMIGTIPKPIRSKSEEDTGVVDTLIPMKPESKVAPYISLASLEQKPKDKKKQPSTTTAMDSLRHLDNLSFDSSSPLKTVVEPPFSISDKVSKPYVQTGLLDSFKKQQPFLDGGKSSSIFAPATLPDPGKFAAPSFDYPSSLAKSLTDTLSKPYVPVSSIGDLKKPSGHHEVSSKPYIPVSAVSDVASKPYVLATSVFQALQQQQQQQKDPKELPQVAESEHGIKDDAIADYPLCWKMSDNNGDQLKKLGGDGGKQIKQASSGYVTIVEPANKEQQQPSSAVVPPYVQLQRFEKPLPPQQAANPSQDEQYSKVTVVPNAMQ